MLFGVILLFASYGPGLSALQWGEWAIRYPKDEASSEKPDVKEGNSESSAESWWWWRNGVSMSSLKFAVNGCDVLHLA